jgi:molybdopterin molybdotransferase
MLSYAEARQKVIEVAGALHNAPGREQVPLGDAFGRILAEPVFADRDYPPFDRSTRDGYAVRSADAAGPGTKLDCLGEIRAGGTFDRTIGPGQCVEIMTGAAVPSGADAVIMIEHTKREGNCITLDRAVASGASIVPRGREIKAGSLVLTHGALLGYPQLAVIAQVGQTRLHVSSRPRVAVLSTGDEVVEVDSKPGPLQIRNSNGLALQTLIGMSGAEPVQLGNAPDELDILRKKIERGLEEDILVLSGGVSMGKYDLVEQALADLSAEFHFTGVAIRPGRPAVFATCRNRLVFGLPGNPVSTMVTFELFVRPAIDVLSGTLPRPLPVFKAKLVTPAHEKGEMTHFLPAHLEWEGREARVSQLPWQGSGDVVALALANGFLIIGPERPDIAPGEWVDVLPRRGAL